MQNQLKPMKSFWEKPQGTTGMIGIGLLVFGAGYLLLKNAAWIAEAFSNLTSAVFMGLGLFTIFWLLSDKKFRTLLWYFYKVGMEKLTSLFIEIDPIGIMKAYVSSLVDKRKNMDQQLNKLKREKGKLQRKIKETEKEIKAHMSKASAASKSQDRRIQAQMSLNTRMAGRRAETVKKLTILLDKMNTLYDKMDKMYFYSGIMIQDIKDQIESIEYERNAIHASHSVMKSAQSIIAGNSSEAELFDKALEHVADDLGAKVGEMERFMDVSQSFIDGVDLDNQVFEEDGLRMLEAWESGNGLDFLNDGSTDYLQVIRTQMVSGTNKREPEPVLLDRTFEKAPELPKAKTFDGEKNFFK
jgi:hypothetical protein